MDSKTRKNNRDMAIKLIPFVAIIGKIVQLFFLPAKYFYDSTRMIGMLTGDSHMAGWAGYKTTVDIFKSIDFFHFTTTTQWSIALGIIGTILLMFLISKCKEMSTSEVVYTLMATGLLNIYVFNISKEPVQFTFFFMTTIIIFLPIKNTLIKIIGCAAIFYWESNTFRTYYALMACMCLVLYLIFWLFRALFKRITVVKIIIAAIMCFVAMFSFVFACQYVDKESYEDVINVRDESKNEYASTAISNPSEVNGNFVKFMQYYVINSVRMMLPIELLFKSPGYAPFVVYQVFLLMYWFRSIKNIKKINDRAFLSLACFTAYLFGSFCFEPDFGSWVRHESASFPVFYIMAYEDLSLKKSENTDYETQTV